MKEKNSNHDSIKSILTNTAFILLDSNLYSLCEEDEECSDDSDSNDENNPRNDYPEEDDYHYKDIDYYGDWQDEEDYKLRGRLIGHTS